MIDESSANLFCVENFFRKKNHELTALPKLASSIKTFAFLALQGASSILDISPLSWLKCNLITSRSPFFAGGHELIVGSMNTIAHVFMYSYYLAANIRPEYKNNIWWKKYITQIQMVTTSHITRVLISP